MTRIHRHQLVHVNPDAVERPTRLADGPLEYVTPTGGPSGIRWLDAVVVDVSVATVTLNNPEFTLESPVEVPRRLVDDDGDVRPQYAADGTPIWGW